MSGGFEGLFPSASEEVTERKAGGSSEQGDESGSFGSFSGGSDGGQSGGLLGGSIFTDAEVAGWTPAERLSAETGTNPNKHEDNDHNAEEWYDFVEPAPDNQGYVWLNESDSAPDTCPVPSGAQEGGDVVCVEGAFGDDVTIGDAGEYGESASFEYPVIVNQNESLGSFSENLEPDEETALRDSLANQKDESEAGNIPAILETNSGPLENVADSESIGDSAAASDRGITLDENATCDGIPSANRDADLEPLVADESSRTLSYAADAGSEGRLGADPDPRDEDVVTAVATSTGVSENLSGPERGIDDGIVQLEPNEDKTAQPDSATTRDTSISPTDGLGEITPDSEQVITDVGGVPKIDEGMLATRSQVQELEVRRDGEANRKEIDSVPDEQLPAAFELSVHDPSNIGPISLESTEAEKPTQEIPQWVIPPPETANYTWIPEPTTTEERSIEAMAQEVNYQEFEIRDHFAHGVQEDIDTKLEQEESENTEHADANLTDNVGVAHEKMGTGTEVHLPHNQPDPFADLPVGAEISAPLVLSLLAAQALKGKKK